MYKLSNTFETGLSDHHKLISTVAKSGSFKGRSRKKCAEVIDLLPLKPLKTLSNKLYRLEGNSYSEFEKAFLTVLNKQAPLKTTFLRHNNNPL